MASNHYQTLGINHWAEPAEIKQAYRKLVKAHHPDRNQDRDNHDQMVAINHAYAILSNPQSRASYDLSIGLGALPKQRPSQTTVRRSLDPVSAWRQQVGEPILALLDRMIDPLNQQIEDLSADPFDEELMEVFAKYIEQCRQAHSQAQGYFRRLPNPRAAASVASHLFHCLNALADGIEELHYFTMNFDDHHLHTAQELWRRAEEMRHYARHALANLG